MAYLNFLPNLHFNFNVTMASVSLSDMKECYSGCIDYHLGVRTLLSTLKPAF